MPTYDLKDAEKLVAGLEGKLRKQAGYALWSAAMRGVSVLQTQLIPAAVPSPVDRGPYRAGWRVEPHRAGGQVDGADIYNVELHALLIERGVRGANVKVGKAMIGALAEWAKRKRLAGADSARGAVSIAWAIARTMQRRGIWGEKGLRLLEKLMVEKMPVLVREEVAALAASPGR